VPPHSELDVGGHLMRMKLCGLILLLAALAVGCGSKFSEADVTRTEAEIKTKFEQDGFVVEQVSMVKDSDRHMTGFARIHKPGMILSKLELNKNCTATMDVDSGKSIWQCR
jgi:hypothetical protein